LAGVLELAAEGPPSGNWPGEDECADRLGLTPYHRLLILRDLEIRFSSPPFDRQLNHELRDTKLQAEIAALTSELTVENARAATEKYRQLLERDPGDWVLRKQFAALLESTGDFEGAIDEWTRITSQLPHHSEGFYKLGTLLNRAKRWNEAEQTLRTALALRPDYARAANSLGISLSHQGRAAESYHEFAKAIELNPDYAEAHVNWGLVLASQGDIEGALKRYAFALHADPDYLPAHQRLGEYHVSREQYSAAEPHYSEVVRLKPNDPAAHLNLGLLLLKMNERVKAIHHIERALELDPANRLARQALAQARQMAGGR
jgi:tetratricopeptide (TPR) repeat protein